MSFHRWFALIFGALIVSSQGQDVVLSDLEDQLGSTRKRANRGNSVKIWGGPTQSQSGTPRIDMEDFDLNRSSGDFIMGIGVDYWWKMKKFPIQTGIGFEGSFLATEIAGMRDFLDTSVVPPVEREDALSTDANAAIFLLNAHIALDLYRYRARMRGLSRLKPYVGGGIGGAQFWFRNNDSMIDPASTVVSQPFSTDQFVFAYKWFAGIEIMINEKVSLFGEYQHYGFEGLEDIDPLETSAWVGGIKIIYEAKIGIEGEEEE